MKRYWSTSISKSFHADTVTPRVARSVSVTEPPQSKIANQKDLTK